MYQGPQNLKIAKIYMAVQEQVIKMKYSNLS